VELFEAIRREYQFRRGNGERSGAEVRRSPANGPGSAGRCGTQTTEDYRKSAPETGTGGCVHRRDPGERSESTAQAAAHGAPDLQPVLAEKPEIKVAEATVRAYVRSQKVKIGLIHRETFVPQSYTWGQEGQVDWYEMVAELGGERQKVQIFCLRSMAGAGAFHHAYPHASQQAFSGSARTGIPLFRRCVSPVEIRQPQVGRAENPARFAA